MRQLGSCRPRTAVLSSVVAATLVAALGTGVALLLAPAVVLFCLLMLGLRPGEQLIERVRARRRPRAHRAPRAVVAHRAVEVVRTARLASSALAMRPPPVSLAAIS